MGATLWEGYSDDTGWRRARLGYPRYPKNATHLTWAVLQDTLYNMLMTCETVRHMLFDRITYDLIHSFTLHIVSDKLYAGLPQIRPAECIFSCSLYFNSPSDQIKLMIMLYRVPLIG